MNYLLILVYSFLFLTAFTCQKNVRHIEQKNFGGVTCRNFKDSSATICKFNTNNSRDGEFCKQGETLINCAYFDMMGE